jgi:hypothetical protein
LRILPRHRPISDETVSKERAIGANSATFSLIDRVALRPLAERFSLESDRSRSEAFLRKARPEAPAIKDSPSPSRALLP